MRNYGMKNKWQAEKLFNTWKARFPEFIEKMGKARKTITNKDILNKSIDELELSVRPHNCLRVRGIRTIGELAEQEPCELLRIRNFGVASFHEITSKLYELRL